MKKELVKLAGVDYWRVEIGMEGSSPWVSYHEVVFEREPSRNLYMTMFACMLATIWGRTLWMSRALKQAAQSEVTKKIAEHFACQWCERLFYYAVLPLLSMIIGCH